MFFPKNFKNVLKEERNKISREIKWHGEEIRSLSENIDC